MRKDSINDSLDGVYRTGTVVKHKKQMPHLTLKDRIISYVFEHPKTTKSDIFINISSSGSAGTIVSSLISTGVFIEKRFDCGNCKYYIVNEEKINITQYR